MEMFIAFLYSLINGGVRYMKIKKTFTAIIVLISAVLGYFCSAAASDTGAVEDLVSRFLHDTKCENVCVVVYEKGEVTYYGDSGALYQIGSLTKAFTGLAVQKLINEGLIDKDAIITDYIPGFEAFYDHEKADITVYDLLRQKSGYTNNEKDYPSAEIGMTLSAWAQTISGRELKSRPGTEYSYSNVNYNLLGLIVENVSGMSYRDYMEHEILTPLGLMDTYADMPAHGRIVEGTRPGYLHAFEFPMAVREASIPAGYFYSDTKDMGRWLGIWTGNTYIPDDLAKAVLDVKTSLVDEGDYFSGWEVFADHAVGHSGGTPNYSSRIVFSDESDTGVCVLCNMNVAAATDSLCNDIFDIISGRISHGSTTDIWTIFDRIFTGVTAAGLIILLWAVFSRRRTMLMISDVILVVLLSLILILFPLIFGAGIKDILFTWAPWSLAGGLTVIAADIIIITARIFTGNKHEHRNKTGKRQPADGNNRISGIQ